MAFINGNTYGFANMEISMLGNTSVVGFTSLTYKTTAEKTNARGRGGAVIGRGQGAENHEGSITLNFSEIKAIFTAARESSGGRIKNITQIPSFNITIAYGSDGTEYLIDTLCGVQFLEHSGGAGLDDQVLEYEIPLIIGEIQWCAQ